MQLGDPCVISCVCPYQAAAGGMPSSHSLDFYLFSLQIKIHIGLVTILEQGKTNIGGSPTPARPLVDFYISTLLLWPQPCLLPVSSQGALPSLLPLHVCAACGAQLCLPFFLRAYSGWNLIPTPAIMENVFVTSPLCGGAAGSHSHVVAPPTPLFCCCW